MYWIKRFAFLILLAIGLGGCAIGIKASIRPDPTKGKVYMEYIDNNEFLEFVLENNIIEGLKREDVIYVDNILNTSDVEYPPLSNKLILAKDAFYEVESEHRLYWLSRNQRLDLEKLKDIYIYMVTNGGTALDNLDKASFPDFADKTSDKPKEPFGQYPFIHIAM
ncbi:MAG: hypothetical protein LBT81_05620 [Helicobacteraceae bacterium]|jgi:hypothetical protein|nr:hypothetical protein [Helicobacteraceae bacterium]